MNQSKDTATVRAIATIQFGHPSYPDTFPFVYDSVGYREVRFLLAPGAEMFCGQAIAEIDNDLPFEKISIHCGSDSLIANTKEEVKQLFDKNVFGSLSTPYKITIK
ncbi:MAG: hypothetical protein IM638_03610 [Bacteroidetes bacterium]|nr:hypothetical protein [Bacteroidota bacterium]